MSGMRMALGQSQPMLVFRTADLYLNAGALAAPAAASSQIFASDPIGVSTLTIKNMVAGSHWRLETKLTGAYVAEGDATGADLAVALSYYQPPQTLALKVRKGTASPYYRPYDTETAVGAANASVFISQISDE